MPVQLKPVMATFISLIRYCRPTRNKYAKIIHRLIVAANGSVKIAFVMAICAEDESCFLSMPSNDKISLTHGVDQAYFSSASKQRSI